MSHLFIEAMNQLAATRARHATESHPRPLEQQRQVQECVANALVALAAWHGVRLTQPLYVTPQGEYGLVAMPEGESRNLAQVAGEFGSLFAAALNECYPRTALGRIAVLSEHDGWCFITEDRAQELLEAFYYVCVEC